MGFSGYLLKKDGKIFPNKWIAFGSYSVTPNQRQDLDSYRDMDGVLHRNILPHQPSKIEFTTPPLHLREKAEFMQLLADRDRFELEYWNDEKDSYRSGTFYSPDLKFEIYHVDEERNDIWYMPIRIAMIEY